MQTGTLVLQARHDTHQPDFDEFYRTHRADAVRWAAALVGSREIGEELAQDALAAVGQRLSTIDNPAAYLRRTVVNRAASWHRWHIRARRREHAPSPASRRRYTQPTNEMLDALAALPYKQRAAVTLRYWADWTDEQIADALGCAPGTRARAAAPRHRRPEEGDRRMTEPEITDDDVIARMRSALDEVAADIDHELGAEVAPMPAPRPVAGRWLAVAAAAVLVVGGVAAIAVNRGHDAPARPRRTPTALHRPDHRHAGRTPSARYVLSLPGLVAAQPLETEQCCPPTPAPGPTLVMAWGATSGTLPMASCCSPRPPCPTAVRAELMFCTGLRR